LDANINDSSSLIIYFLAESLVSNNLSIFKKQVVWNFVFPKVI